MRNNVIIMNEFVKTFKELLAERSKWEESKDLLIVPSYNYLTLRIQTT